MWQNLARYGHSRRFFAMNNQNFFESTEKKVELLIDPSLPSLRRRGDRYWEQICVCAGAQVISKISNGGCDAYLLSESSLFVFDHKLIMITCGQTRLPDAVLEILRSVPPDKVRFFMYERKNETYPHEQPSSFFDDVRQLNAALPGKAFQFGDEDDHHLYLFHLDRPSACDPRDVTLEILMYGIPEKLCRIFSPGGDRDTSLVRQRTGIDRIIPGFEIDDHLFEPGGYSLNAIKDEEYWAVHVTPERASSYASFETNYRFGDDLEPIARRVLEQFSPRSFDLIIFDHAAETGLAIEPYRLKEHVEQDLDCGYRVRFLSYFRPRTSVRHPVELAIQH
jgi:S-adenosylmethionine decarboxylase